MRFDVSIRRSVMRVMILGVLIFMISSVQADQFFVGVPLSKVTVSEQGTEAARVSGLDALEYKVVIEQIGEGHRRRMKRGLRRTLY